MFGCENCVQFHVAEEQSHIQWALAAFAALFVVAALVVWIRTPHGEGWRTRGWILAGLGLFLVPVAAVPLVQPLVVQGPFPQLGRSAPAFIDCDKAVYATWNLDRPGADARLAGAAEVCRGEARAATMGAGALGAGAVALVVAGVLIVRRRPDPGPRGAQDAVEAVARR